MWRSRCAGGAAFELLMTLPWVSKEAALPTQDVLLLEYDTRFSVIAGAGFVYYDLDEPLAFIRAHALQGTQDVVVVDPPFHSEPSQKKIASTVTHILRPGGRLVLLTGLTLSPVISTIYPSPPLRRRSILIEHGGVGRLATPYGCWVGGGEEEEGSKEEGFGAIVTEDMEL
ncbi:hypothetical protein K439DRAFT_1636397 [Ramaria rubella]|nr:hypothetical protein K439DRAFT_1636397 [Ramaria rubella]